MRGTEGVLHLDLLETVVVGALGLIRPVGLRRVGHRLEGLDWALLLISELLGDPERP